MTASQTRIVNLFKNAAGWEVTRIEVIGRKLFIVAKKPGSIFMEEDIYGTISVQGNIELEWSIFGVRQKIESRELLQTRLKGIAG